MTPKLFCGHTPSAIEDAPQSTDLTSLPKGFACHKQWRLSCSSCDQCSILSYSRATNEYVLECTELHKYQCRAIKQNSDIEFRNGKKTVTLQHVNGGTTPHDTISESPSEHSINPGRHFKAGFSPTKQWRIRCSRHDASVTVYLSEATNEYCLLKENQHEVYRTVPREGRCILFHGKQVLLAYKNPSASQPVWNRSDRITNSNGYDWSPYFNRHDPFSSFHGSDPFSNSHGGSDPFSNWYGGGPRG